jgi:hypothetical protein
LISCGGLVWNASSAAASEPGVPLLAAKSRAACCAAAVAAPFGASFDVVITVPSWLDYNVPTIITAPSAATSGAMRDANVHRMCHAVGVERPKLNMRIPADLLAALDDEAARSSRTRTEVILAILRAHTGRLGETDRLESIERLLNETVDHVRLLADLGTFHAVATARSMPDVHARVLLERMTEKVDTERPRWPGQRMRP